MAEGGGHDSASRINEQRWISSQQPGLEPKRSVSTEIAISVGQTRLNIGSMIQPDLLPHRIFGQRQTVYRMVVP